MKDLYTWVAEKRGIQAQGMETALIFQQHPPTPEERAAWDQEQTADNIKRSIGIAESKAVAEAEAQHDALIKLASNKRREATERVVALVHQTTHIYTTREDASSEMWIYDEGIYVPNGRTYVKEVARKIFDEAYTSSLANEIIAKVEADTYIHSDEFFNAPAIDKVVVHNGILNIFNGELEPFNPKQIFFNKLPVEYEKEQDCPNIMKFFEEILKHPAEDMRVMQEFFGYCLLKEYKYEKSFMFMGSGRNGKGKTLSLLRALLGDENVVSVRLQDLDENNFAVSQLFHKLVNIGGDISIAPLKETGTFKNLTGRDQVTADRKHLSSISFQNYAKMVFASNELPRTYDTTEGFFSRWMLMDFPFKFIPQAEYDSLPASERHNKKIEDPEIIEKLTTDEELSGLLNWALEGLARLQSQKGFSNSQSSDEIERLWMRRSDSFQAFCMDHVRENWEGTVDKSVLRKHYTTYCRENRVSAVGDKGIKNGLATLYGAGDATDQTGGSKTYVWKGIELVDLPDLVRREVEMESDETEELYPLNKLRRVIDKLDDGNGADSDDIIKLTNIDLQEFDQLIQLLMTKGDVISNRPGRYKVLR